MFQPAHGIFLCVPAIEVSDNADAICGRRPDGERDTALAFVRDRVRAEFVVDTQVFAFAEEMEIEIAECWHETGGWASLRQRALAYTRGFDSLLPCTFAESR